MTAFDAALWSDALQAGAFDALSMDMVKKQLVAAVLGAFRRWHCAQLVRAARDQNPFAQRVAMVPAAPLRVYSHQTVKTRSRAFADEGEQICSANSYALSL